MSFKVKFEGVNLSDGETLMAVKAQPEGPGGIGPQREWEKIAQPF